MVPRIYPGVFFRLYPGVHSKNRQNLALSPRLSQHRPMDGLTPHPHPQGDYVRECVHSAEGLRDGGSNDVKCRPWDGQVLEPIRRAGR